MKRRIISVMTAASMLLTLLPIRAFADTAGLILAGDAVTADCIAGETILLPIRATENTGYAAGTLDVEWDSSVLILKAVQYDSALAPANYAAPIGASGSCRLAFGSYVTTENFTGTGVFFTLEFEIAETAAAGSYPVTLRNPSAFDKDVQKVSVSAENGEVTLEEPVFTTSETTTTSAETTTTLIETTTTSTESTMTAVETTNTSTATTTTSTEATTTSTETTTTPTETTTTPTGTTTTSTETTTISAETTTTSAETTATATDTATATTDTTTAVNLVLAADSVTAACRAGETVLLPVRASVNTGYAAGTLDVEWDSSVLILKAVQYDSELAPQNNASTIGKDGSYRLAFGSYLAAEHFTGTGVFFTLEFEIAANANPGNYSIALRNPVVYDNDLHKLSVTAADGNVTLQEPETTTTTADTTTTTTGTTTTTAETATTTTGTATTESTVAASADLVLSAESVTAVCSAGRTVILQISAAENTGYAAGTLDVEWDSSALILKAVQYDSALAPMNQAAPIGEGGRYRLAFGSYIAAENFSETGVFFTLEFEIAENAKPGSCTIALRNPTIYNNDIQRISVTAADGNVTLLAPAKGDYNCDGEVTLADTVLLARYIAEDTTLTVQQTTGLLRAEPDYDGDGLVTVLDVRALLKKL